jgi:hypothetical protein
MATVPRRSVSMSWVGGVATRSQLGNSASLTKCSAAVFVEMGIATCPNNASVSADARREDRVEAAPSREGHRLMSHSVPGDSRTRAICRVELLVEPGMT